MDIDKYFENLRFDPRHHLGLGDIRLTIAQQEEIIAEVERLKKRVNNLRQESNAKSRRHALETLDSSKFYD